ncbi:FEKKY domain-containing protein [Flammeovirga aprica]|uniref:Uncharacterized protein n=1 Tax=Flammeovirga aprica JL-4 TaxID=694437 RepID=A0A7X9RWW3_9BACT|nr:hypothetical protein [Flammeovirga aprica]NME70232.1 hypothetical protein [Flammeovirga aprica JL-4]
MKSWVLIVLLFFSVKGFGQLKEVKLVDENVYEKSGATNLRKVQNIEKAKELAIFDINQGEPFILLQGSIAPSVSMSDFEYEETFGVNYFRQGCSGIDLKIAEAYNFEIFNFLTSRFKNSWIREIRMDAVGLKKWKEN